MDIDEDLVRALHRAGAVDPGVDTRALVAGAHRRARTLRRRRRSAVGLVAVAALAVPLGVSQWSSTTTPPPVVASPSPSAPAVVDGEVVEAAVLPDAAVLQVLPGATGTTSEDGRSAGGLPARGDYGMCTDLTLPAEDEGATRLLGLRTRVWSTDATVADPFPATVSESVRVLSPGGAQSVVDFAREQLSTACAAPEETTAWSVGAVEGAPLGQDSVTGYAGAGSDTAPRWRTRTVVVQGDVVVDLRTELAVPTADEAVRTTTALARQALQLVGENVPAAQVQR